VLSREASSSSALDARLLDGFDVRDSVLWQLARGETPHEDSTSEGTATLEKDLESAPRDEPEKERWTRPDEATRTAKALAELMLRLENPKDRERAEKAAAVNDRETLGALAARAFLPLDEDTRLGRVNLNTASAVVLGSLPGLNPGIGADWVRERQDRQARSRSPEPVVLFNRPSDLLANQAFWNADAAPPQRYRRLTRLLPAITFTTSSVLMDSRTLVEESSPSQSRHPTVSRALALVAFDREKIEFVAWNQTP
jgi:DNA uptake protein ComE-like DNA-binding protein